MMSISRLVMGFRKYRFGKRASSIPVPRGVEPTGGAFDGTLVSAETRPASRNETRLTISSHAVHQRAYRGSGSYFLLCEI